MKLIQIYDHDSADVTYNLISFTQCPSCQSPLSHAYHNVEDGWPSYACDSDLWCCIACGFWYGTSDMQRFAGEHSTNEATVIARLKKFDLSGLELPYRELVSWLSRNYQDIYFVNPRRVEEIVRDVLREAINVELAMTTQSRDGGIDLIGLEGDKKLIVEVKRYAKSRKIGVRIVRNLAGVLLRENSRRGLIVTTSDFTETSKMEASILAKQDQTYPVEIELRTLDEFIPWLNIVAVKLQGRRESKDYWDRKAIRFVHIPWSI